MESSAVFRALISISRGLARIGSCLPPTRTSGICQCLYPRGSLRERLNSWREMDSLVRGLVIDPDSRLTQLGLLPVCAEENYLFFESRSYGADTDEALPELSARWVAQTLGVEDSRPYRAPQEQGAAAEVAISFGVGDNLLKRIPDPFEESLLAHLSRRQISGRQICIDRGVGGEEAERVNRAAARLGIRTWDGSFAGFASIIARSGSLHRLRFSRPACRRRLWCSPALRVCGVSVRAHVSPLAAYRIRADRSSTSGEC